MSNNTIVVDRNNYIGVITLNRPEQFNTFSSEMAKKLRQTLIELDNDKTVRVIVVKGAGKAFCTGVDLSEFFHLYTIIWTPDSIIWLLDNIEFRRDTAGQVDSCNSPMEIHFNMWPTIFAGWAG